MKFGIHRKILLALIGALALGTGLSALVVPYFIREPAAAILAAGALVLLVSIGLGSFWLNRVSHPIRVPTGDSAEEQQQSVETLEQRVQGEIASEVALSEAKRLRKAHGEFLAGMSHELRTPLNAILGYAQILRRDGHMTERQARGLATIEDSGQQLLALINDIQDLARINACRIALHPVDTDLAALLRSMCDIIRARAEEKGLLFTYEGSQDLPSAVRIDGKRLEQVLLNLLGNAVKHRDSGRIALRVTNLAARGEQTGIATARLRFEVEDNDVGVTGHPREGLFLPFERAADATRHGGARLGLEISGQLVRLMGGEVQVRSEQDHGSTFRFELDVPIAAREPDTVRGEASAIDGSQKMVIPPLREMETLYQLALTGNMRDIHERADHLKNTDPRYSSFAQHLQNLAQRYQSLAILKLVERYRAEAALLEDAAGHCRPD